MNEKVIEDISTEAEADQLVQDFIDAGCNEAAKVLQQNGLWKVVASCPNE